MIRDNFSRAMLACKTTTEYSAAFAKQTLESVLQNFDLLSESGMLITDNGVGNKGALQKWLEESDTKWKKIIAQVDIKQSNSMVEAANRILKYRVLYIQSAADPVELISILKTAVESYNNIPNNQLYGLTPNEVLKGAIPNKHHFRQQIKLGKQNRIIANRFVDCDLANKI